MTIRPLSPAPTTLPLADYDSLVLQGGGCRCFFSLGFLETAGPLLTGVRQIATVSAASAMGCAHVLGTHGDAMARFAARVRKNPKNFYFSRVLRGASPTPHYEMYRDAMRESLNLAGNAGLERLQKSPQRLRILVAAAPTRSKLLATGLGALSVLRQRPGPLLRGHVLDAATFSSIEHVVEAVLASSAFPPFTPVPYLGGIAVIDGGAVAPIPLCALLGAKQPLLVLTRPQPNWPLPAGLRCVAPPVPLGVSTWEYADEPALWRVFDAGRRCGERFAQTGETQLS